MDFGHMATEIVQLIGFRNMMLSVCGIGFIMLIWLMASLPGNRGFRLLVQIFCLLGLVFLVALLPLRARFILPVMVIRAVSLIVSITLMIILLQFTRLLMLILAAIIALMWRGPIRVVISRWISLLVLLGGLGLGAYSFWNCLQVPEIKEVSVPIHGLPKEFEGFHIVQITDTHLGTIFDVNWVNAVVDRVNSLNPDVVAVTGDVGEFSPDSIKSALAPLRRLEGHEGVFFSLGNHETYQGLQSWISFYNSAGTLLRNSNVRVTRDSSVLVLGGLDDMSPDPGQTFANTPKNSVRILLGHRPQFASLAAASDVDLMLTGHTHGGLMPIIRHLVAGANRGYVSGLYKTDHMWLYVSNGTGLWSYIPLRLFTPSEITSLRLTRATQ